MTVDKIAQSLDFPFAPERVWRAIATPAELTRWFSHEAIFEPAVNSPIRLRWEGYEDSIGVITAYERPTTFAFRWRHESAGGLDDPIGEGNSTLVTFTITPTPAGCRLEVVETGFASLPVDMRAKAYQENEGGWRTELAELVDYLNT